MRAAMLAAVLGVAAVSLVVPGAAELLELRIGVVEEAPERGARLAAAAAAGAGAGALADADGVSSQVEPNEPLAVPGDICRKASEGALAVLGGAAGAAAAARAGLALLLTAPPFGPARERSAALELYPHEDVLAEACAALCEAKDWRQAVLLHAGSARAAVLLAPDSERLVLRARQLPPPHDDNALRNLLLMLKKLGATNFIVWCSAACSVRVLDAAQRVGLLAERHAYLLPALDAHAQPLADYSYGGANITALRLFDPESEAVVKAMEAWRENYLARLGEAADEEEIARVVANPPTDVLLAYDAARVLAAAVERLQLPDAAPGDCERCAAAFHADTLLNYIRSEEWAGASGPLRWEAAGARRAVRLQAVELVRGGRLEAAASWAPRAPVEWRERPAPPPPPDDVMTNRTFVVIIAQNKPYVMRRQSANRLSGNDRYEGFCIELIDRLAKHLSFNYTFIEQPDGAYGTFNKTTRQWNGMLRRLMDDKNVHFAITDLTITAEREAAVDFTTPFMNLGISILYRKPKPPEPALLAFLLPFSNGVWLGLGLAYLGTSLVLYVVGRLCPEEWQNPYPCVDEPEALENQFTLANALWFNLGAVLLQGSEIAPVAYGTRAVASSWWLFALVITSSYTANLATLLAAKTSSDLIHNVRELADNEHGITYGAKAGGSTYTFFEFSNSELYKKMFAKMKEQEMPRSNEEGIRKVIEENYAFLAESTTIEYTVERNCEVVMIGDLLDSKGYGIAMKKDSVYRHPLNLALLGLQEAGVLREMKHRWWKEKHGGGACQESEDRESEELSMKNFLGLFLVLVVGCALGVVVSFLDLAWAAWRRPRDPAAGYGARLAAELRFVFRFERSEKPVRGPLSAPPSAPASASPSASSGLPRSHSRSRSRSHSRSHSAEQEEEAGASPRRRPRSPSLRSGRSRRRSSIHAANVRMARHRASSPRLK